MGDDLVCPGDGAKLEATYKGHRVGTLAIYATTSFFPAKPLGCNGGFGVIFTDDVDNAELLRSLRFHGKGGGKYDNLRIALISKLDTMRADILLEKLCIFPDELLARQKVAERYSAALANSIMVSQDT